MKHLKVVRGLLAIILLGIALERMYSGTYYFTPIIEIGIIILLILFGIDEIVKPGSNIFGYAFIGSAILLCVLMLT